MLYFVAAVALCVRVSGAGANLNTVNSYFTLESNQLYIYITIHLKKINIQMNLNIPLSLIHI